MLHILIMILKILGVILLVLLGILLLILLLVLFCPVRYRAEASKETTAAFREAKAQAEVSWLFRGICAGVVLESGKPKLGIRLFGIPLEKILKKKKAPGSSSGKTGAETMPETIPETIPEEHLPGSDQPSLEDKTGKQTTKEQKTPERKPPAGAGKEPEVKAEDSRVKAEDSKEKTEEKAGVIREKPEEKTAEKKQKPKEKAAAAVKKQIVNKKALFFRKIRAVLQKIRDLPGRIREKLTDLKNKMDRTVKKLSWWKSFLGNERTKAAVTLVITQIKGLIRHILPTDIRGDITFGSEDPSLTGKLCAVLGATIPFHRNRIRVTPVFECENIFGGEVSLKGRVYGIVVLIAVLKVLLNRNIHYVIKKWKHKEA